MRKAETDAWHEATTRSGVDLARSRTGASPSLYVWAVEAFVFLMLAWPGQPVVVRPSTSAPCSVYGYLYSLRNVERRPVLCSFKRIEGGLSKKSRKKIRLYILHSSAASLLSIRVPRPRKHPRVSRVALSARTC